MCSAQCGITLIELLVVMVVIGILASLAMPAYQQYAREGRRSDALQRLSEMVALQEQFRLNNKTYTANIGAGGLNRPVTTEDGSYTFSLVVSSAACPLVSCFVFEATPIGAQTADMCGIMG